MNATAYELLLQEKYKIHPVFHVSLLKSAVPDPFPGHNLDPPAPIMIDDKEEYEIEAVMDCRRRRGSIWYLIKWKGYSPEESSWEQGKQCPCPKTGEKVYPSPSCKVVSNGHPKAAH